MASNGGVAGAANMSKRKRHAPKVLKGAKKGVRERGHRMDREMNTPPHGGPWGERIYVG